MYDGPHVHITSTDSTKTVKETESMPRDVWEQLGLWSNIDMIDLTLEAVCNIYIYTW